MSGKSSSGVEATQATGGPLPPRVPDRYKMSFRRKTLHGRELHYREQGYRYKRTSPDLGTSGMNGGNEKAQPSAG